MKTISGNLVSVQPISLSKAARYISDFASFENNGVSNVVCIYLDHASEAFNSLVQLNKDLKYPQSSHKRHKKSISVKKNDASLRNDEAMNYDDGERKIRNNRDEKQDELLEDKRVGVNKEDMGTSRKQRKEKIHKKDNVEAEDSINGELRNVGENGGNVDVGDMVNQLVERESKKKKTKTVDADGKLKDNSVESARKKMKRTKVLDD